MSRRQQAVQADYYDQRPVRPTKGDNQTDESKRRKMLRWFKKTLGMKPGSPEHKRYHQPNMHSMGSVATTANTYVSSQDYQESLGFVDESMSLSHLDIDPERCIPEQHRAPTSFSSTMRSRRSSVSMNDPHASGPSIYEYHHQMPRHRQPKPDPYHKNITPHVLIMGAGMGGLCLAQGLKKYGIAFTIFERDPTPNYRTQGYRLRINGAGYEALKVNLAHEDFEVFIHATGQFLPGFMYIDAESGGAGPDSVKFAHRSNATEHVFSIDRSMLRSLLLTDLEEGKEIQYGMAFQEFHVLSNGRVQVEFENGRIVEGSVLVGADGTTSRVRRQYIPRNITLLDTDSGAIYGKTLITPEIEQYFATASTTLVTSEHPKMCVVIEPRCGSNSSMVDYLAASGGMENPANTELPDLNNYLCWVLMARADLFHMDANTTVHDLYAMCPEEVAELSIKMTSSWCPRVRALIERQDPEWCSFLRISSMSPEVEPWQPSVVTLLGDAVHTMVPAGIGCNAAMHDARVLTKMFVEHGVNVNAIAAYEHIMRENGSDGIDISMNAGQRMFGLPDEKEMRTVVC